MNVKTVVIVSEFAYVEGGATNVAIQTSLGLATAGLKVIYFSAVGPIDKRLQSKNVRVECLEQNDILHDPNRLKAMKHGLFNTYSKKHFKIILNNLDPDSTIIHVHTWTKALSSSIFLAAAELDFHVVITVHDYFLTCPNGGLYNYKKQKICDKQPLSLDCILCNCDSRKYAHKLWRVGRQLIQNNTIKKNDKISYIFISNLSKKELSERMTISKNQFFLRNPISYNKCMRVQTEHNDIYTFVGRLSDEKGVKLFCQAVIETGVKGVIIGDGPLKNQLETQYGKKIMFTGWLDHEKISEFFSKTKCLVFPSKWLEVAPLTPLEAQAFGIPSIVPDRCGASEFIENQKNGLIFKTGNLEDLEAKIKMLRDNSLVKKLSFESYNSYDEKKYSVEAYTRNLLSIYKKIMQK